MATRPARPETIASATAISTMSMNGFIREATADIAASFVGDHGELWLVASPVAETGDGLVGAVMTVRQAPWSDKPHGPFIIELFTAPDH